jgi:hypothetical protein
VNFAVFYQMSSTLVNKWLFACITFLELI